MLMKIITFFKNADSCKDGENRHLNAYAFLHEMCCTELDIKACSSPFFRVQLEFTPLHNAAFNGQHETCKLLL